MNQTFQDHFSVSAAQYAGSRPTYPKQLFQYLAALCVSHQRAWDCGTGNGQAAIELAEFFEHVDASEASAEQLRNAKQSSKVSYHLCKAENSKLPSDSFDLVTVAQALHWFDLENFYSEVNRVLKPDGVFAAWGYSWFSINQQIDEVIEHELLAPIKTYWAEQNKLLWDGYKTISFPFNELSPPDFEICLKWGIHELVQYVETWSALRAYQTATGDLIQDRLSRCLQSVWGGDATRHNVSMQIHFRVGTKASV